MAYQRISTQKRSMILAALNEGVPIRAVTRLMKCGQDTVKRVIEETGEAMAVYMMDHFTDLRCERLEMDEQWQFVGIHGQRMRAKERDRGDFWLWCALDADSKLVVSYRIGTRKADMAEDLVRDAAQRITGNVQIASDKLASYAGPIRAYFGERASYGTEAKIWDDCRVFNPKAWPEQRKNGVPSIAKATREAVLGEPDLHSLTTAHVERVFLSVRQEVARFTRCSLAYSKCLRMHKLAIHCYMAIYNLVRKHRGLNGQTPAQAAGLEDKRWTLEDIVAETERYWKAKEDAAFEAAFAKLEAERQ